MGQEWRRNAPVPKWRHHPKQHREWANGDQSVMSEFYGTNALLRGCAGKVAYPSKRQAASVARKLQRQGRVRESFGAYKCGGSDMNGLGCGKWHLGHSSRRDKRGAPRAD